MRCCNCQRRLGAATEVGLRTASTANAVLYLAVEKSKAVPTKRRAAIKYSDKKRVERFREYATGEFIKRDLEGALTALIGDLALDTALRDRGRTERELDEGAPWESLRWQRRWNPSENDGTLRWRVSTALEVLDTLAHVADEGFESTHGGAQRKRGASNATRWGNGLSDQAKHASAIYVRIRRMIGQVRAGAFWQAEQTRLDLTKLGVQLGAVDPDPAHKDAVVAKLLEERDSFRRLLQGREASRNASSLVTRVALGARALAMCACRYIELANGSL